MGKAARRRKARRLNYLVMLSHEDPGHFEAAWEMRLSSWLSEIRDLAREWAVGGKGSKTRVFEIMEEALGILEQCEKSIYKKHAPEIYGLICHECCSQVSRVIDPRLYRLSNMDQLVYKAKKTVRV